MKQLYVPRFLLLLFFLSSPLSQPALADLNAKLLGQLDPFTGHNRYADIWGEGNYAYLCSYNGNGLMIIDISNPRVPVLAGVFDPVGSAAFKDVVVIDGIAYCSDDSGKGVYIADVRDPKNPKELSHITATQNGFPSVHELFATDGLLFEADSRRPSDARPPRVKVFDVTNPSQPVFIRDVFTTDTLFIHSMVAINGRLYTSGWGGTTDIFDIRNIRTQDPPLLGTISSGNSSHTSWVSNDGQILANCRETLNGDVRLFDISNPANPRLLSTLTAQALGLEAYTPHNPMIVGNLLFIAWYQAGTVVFDITDPVNPIMVGNYDTFPSPVACPQDCYGGNWGVYALLGLDRVLLSDLDGGLFVVDFSAAGNGAKTVSAASFNFSSIAPKSIVAAFGANLATVTRAATAQPLPTELSGTRVTVQDFAGVERAAPLFFVSPTQINYEIPADSKPGPALVKITASDGKVTYGATTIQAAAPALFTLNQSGSGGAVALDAFNFTPAPFVAARPNGEPNILAVFATGLGNDATDLDADVSSNVRAMLDEQPITVAYAGRVPHLAGLNQLNIVMPAGLMAGIHRLKVFRGGMASNEVTITTR
jgi:uncharacterized protein (TIGR03437 family)